MSALLRDSRLVTLTGTGGCGKTRLAQEVARQYVDSDGEFAFVDLAAVESADFVGGAILSSLGHRATAEQQPFDLVSDVIGEQRFLLVLDNFEHVIAAAPLVVDLLDRCPALTTLVTSRRRLRVSAERLFEVQPLAVPAPGERIEALSDYDSVRLFLARASEAGRAGAIDTDALPVVAEICRRLGGLPLAIELATAHARYLSTRALLGRLDEPLTFLSGGPIDAPVRQRALEHSIAWSYDLLENDAKVFFGRLGVFDGPFTLEAAHEVAGHGLHESDTETLESLAGLSDHGLVLPMPHGGAEARFGMHDAIREFAKGAVADASATRDRMLAHYVELAERADSELEGPEQAFWTRKLESELDSIRGALAWAHRSASTVALLRLATALGSFWRWHGDLREGREWLSRAVLTSEPGNESILSKAQRRAARIYSTLGERDQALALYGSARKNAEAALDHDGVAESLISAGGVLIEDARPTDAQPLIDDGLERARACGDPNILAQAFLQKGLLDHYTGDLEAARRWYTEAADLAKHRGNLRLAAVALLNAADTRLMETDYEAAVPLASRGAAYLDAFGDLAYSPWAHLLLGLAYRRLTRMEEALREVRTGAALALRAASPVDMILAAEVMADWLGAAGKSHESLALWATATDARETLDFPRQPWDDVWINEGIDRDRSALGSEAAARAWNDGANRAIREAVSSGLDGLSKVPLAAKRTHWDGRGHRKADKRALTARELEVLALLADGHSNEEIARALSISPGTATAHVARIKWKLDAGTRFQILTAAISRGLVKVATKR